MLMEAGLGDMEHTTVASVNDINLLLCTSHEFIEFIEQLIRLLLPKLPLLLDKH